MKDKYKEQARSNLEALRLLSKEKGITEQALADATGFKQPNINRMLTCRSIPRYDNYLKLKDAIRRY